MTQHVFIPECCMLSEEAANTHLIGKLGWSDKIYNNEVKHANHHITEANYGKLRMHSYNKQS
jgi:hypothetical protein